jgi:hypothetical protein
MRFRGPALAVWQRKETVTATLAPPPPEPEPAPGPEPTPEPIPDVESLTAIRERVKDGIQNIDRKRYAAARRDLVYVRDEIGKWIDAGVNDWPKGGP